jgi:cell wall-associated NlpC family hydrolase
MCRSFLPLLIAATLATAASAPARDARSGHPAASWAEAAIRLVTARGLMGGDAARFRPEDPLTRGELADLVAGLTGKPLVQPAGASVKVSVAALDSALVRALGLGGAAATFAATTRAAGVAPPTRFGTEVVARLLGLRTNHPAPQDGLELLPDDPVTRAETAFSAARILGFDGTETAAVSDAVTTFVPPVLTDWQRRILATAVDLIGYPYVWGGTSERAEAPFGVRARGGFDCSGFVWRVYKLEAYPGGEALAETLRGRTTYAMSAEVPRALRIPFAKLQPADVVFFGGNGARSSPSAVDHMGIYLGGGWFVHSSAHGVALDRIAGSYRDRFAWARRPLAEAGLAG